MSQSTGNHAAEKRGRSLGRHTVKFEELKIRDCWKDDFREEGDRNAAGERINAGGRGCVVESRCVEQRRGGYA